MCNETAVIQACPHLIAVAHKALCRFREHPAVFSERHPMEDEYDWPMPAVELLHGHGYMIDACLAASYRAYHADLMMHATSRGGVGWPVNPETAFAAASSMDCLEISGFDRREFIRAVDLLSLTPGSLPGHLEGCSCHRRWWDGPMIGTGQPAYIHA